MDLVKIATYPFLSQAREWIRQEGIDINEILFDDTYERARHLGRVRVENALEKIYVGERSLADEIDCMLEIFSYPIARMITACIHDDFLTGRYALAEARHAAHHLKNESCDFIGDVAKEVDIAIRLDESIMIHFTEYLKYSPTKYKSWKLVNRPLKDGYIILRKKEMVRLIQEALSKKIFTEVLDSSPTSDMRDGLREEITKIQDMLMVHKERMGENEI
jgi:DNA primase large subunit